MIALTFRLGSFRVSRANENIPYASQSYGSQDSVNSNLTNSRSASSPLQSMKSSLKVVEKLPKKMDSMEMLPAQVDSLFSNKVLFPVPSDISLDSSESFQSVKDVNK